MNENKKCDIIVQDCFKELKLLYKFINLNKSQPRVYICMYIMCVCNVWYVYMYVLQVLFLSPSSASSRQIEEVIKQLAKFAKINVSLAISGGQGIQLKCI